MFAYLLLAVASATYQPATKAQQAEAMALVKAELKDPESAKFKGIKRTETGAYCGWVNSKNAFGGYTVQGRGESGDRVLRDAKAVAEAGAFSVVLEKVPERLARRITEEVAIPTIGIGASAACDGQVLVTDDMLGMFTEFRPKFVKRYAELGQEAEAAIGAYAAEVRARKFPAAEHLFADAPKAAAEGDAS